MAHAHHPYVKGLEGVIVPFLAHIKYAPDEHPWRVVFIREDTPRPGWAYFKASELELLLQGG